jgi:hypothetical protein
MTEKGKKSEIFITGRRKASKKSIGKTPRE